MSTASAIATSTDDRRRWRPQWLAIGAAVLAWMGVLLFVYPDIAAWFSQYNQSLLIENYSAQARDSDLDPSASEQLSLAREYNAAVNSGALLEVGERLPTAEGSAADDALDYDTLLRATPSDVMARLRIPAVDVDLPVYHGTSDDTLLRGAGHLRGTSLPVGGEGTHSVITAHRGLAEAKMFTNLDRVQEGDTFTIEVLGEVLTYQVIRTQVVEPDEREALRPVVGEDLVTLVTCTPLGINSHRILVTGERILPTPVDDVAAAGARPDIPGFPWWAVILGAVVLALAAYVWAAGRQSADGPATASGATDLRRARMSPTATVPPPARTETTGGALMAAEDAAGAQQKFVDEAVAKMKETYENISQTVGGALDSDKAEQVTDSILDAVSDFAKKILPEQFHAKIDEVRDQVDRAVGQ